MRLIDADSLVQYLASRKCECVDDVGKSWNYGIDTAIRVVGQCITIDAEPVRHGHWGDATLLKSNFMFRNGLHATQRQCTHCHRYSVQLYDCPEIIPKMYQYRFCPHCGAKMDEEVET